LGISRFPGLDQLIPVSHRSGQPTSSLQPTPEGYRLRLACPCGAVFERRVRPEEAADHLVRSGLLPAPKVTVKCTHGRDELLAALGDSRECVPGVSHSVRSMTVLASAVFLMTLFGSGLVGGEQPGATAKEDEVFSLEPVTVTAPWPLIPPQYKDIRKPPYPEAARLRELEGTVLLLLKVRPDGSVGERKIHKPSGTPLLDDAAVKAARHGTFIPARRGPRPVEAWVEVPVKFELK